MKSLLFICVILIGFTFSVVADEFQIQFEKDPKDDSPIVRAGIFAKNSTSLNKYTFIIQCDKDLIVSVFTIGYYSLAVERTIKGGYRIGSQKYVETEWSVASDSVFGFKGKKAIDFIHNLVESEDPKLYVTYDLIGEERELFFDTSGIDDAVNTVSESCDFF